MPKTNDGGQAFPCKWCAELSYIKQGHILLCKKHYRFLQMRTNAKRHSKSVPEYLKLENILPKDMACYGCSRTMVWISKEDSSRVISLQHDRDGKIRLICRACNTRHAQHEGDSFYMQDKTKKLCPRCKQSKPFSGFYKDNNNRWLNLKTYCKECSNEYHKKWARNRAA